MNKNYRVLALMVFSFFALQTVVGQELLKTSKHAPKISEYLSKNKTKYNLSSSDLENIQLNREVYSASTGITHSYLNQAYKGVKIHNAISTVGIKNNQVFHFANKFKSGISKKINVESPALNRVQAIQKAATHFNLGNVGSIKLLDSKNGKDIYSKGDISQENIPVEQVYYQMPDGELRLSWNLSIYTVDSQHWWSVRVDAVTGEILDTNDWVTRCKFNGDHAGHGVNNLKNKESKTSNLFKTSEATMFVDGAQYNVFPLPIESPSHGAVQLVTNPADATASPFGWHDTDGNAGPEYTITRGNNVWAQEDRDGANDEGYSPDGTAALDFNFSLNINQEPIGYQDVAITNLFYTSNMMHDIFYHYGFDEASGNFQENNYGKGGAEGDVVLADAQDAIEHPTEPQTDNANFATPPDGSSPRMQMYLWNNFSIPPLTINNGTLAGGYAAALPSTTEGDDGIGNITGPSTVPVTGDLVVVDDGTGAPEEGCNALVNGAEVNGKIAVIRRGSCNFTVKIQNAQDAGAIAVIVANHNNPTNDPDYGEYVSMYGVTDPAFTIPSIFINFDNGDAIINAIQGGETLNATIVVAPRLDSSFDNGVIVHEYGHGISNRLTGGADTSDCLSTNFQMGEGWSDFFTFILTMKASDDGVTGKGIATYVNGEGINGQGIRLRKYSTDMSVNEYTFEATNDNTILGEDEDGDPIILNRLVHYNGTIWATMLWDLTWAYIDKYGFDPDLKNGTGGNNRVMQVVMEGLKLQGCNPEFIEGRDAILAADTAITGGEDQCLIWEVFARRGLGVDASEGIPFKFEDQVNGFATPDPSDPSLANCTTLSANIFTVKDFKIYPNPANDRITIKSGKNLGSVSINLVDINGRPVLTKQADLLGEVELNTSAIQSGLYILNIKGEHLNTNQKIIIE
ncbi:T9SS-dependent M36 family metallopeptidase [Flavobacteriaceae bacterium GSB9]|nr:T9SS-dependent M36 family metallopeptidase [Flavobacteriaceae bacterium GSB9]